MATAVAQKLSRFFPSVRQLGQMPKLLGELTSPLPDSTVGRAEVPRLFWKPYIYSGYRPLHRTWRFYFLSLFQKHNEAVNVWTHLVAALVLLLRLAFFAGTVDFVGDPHARPLFLIVLASITYLLFSALAHLLQAKSEFWHYSFFFLDYVGVAVYQFGSALAHFYYAIEPAWHARVAAIFLPAAAFLAWLSCAGSCYTKYRQLPGLLGRVCQEMPSGLAYALDISPVIHRIYVAQALGQEDPAVLYHKCQVAFFLLAAAFFSGLAYALDISPVIHRIYVAQALGQEDPAVLYHKCQVAFFLLAAAFFSACSPERWFPGKCHIFGQGHQLFHVFLVLCTLAQLEAVALDYEARRSIYEGLHRRAPHNFSALFLLTVVCSVLTALFLSHRVKQELNCKED